ncbi:PREDICTED: suppressor of cytokine signaling 5 isoform X2 [Rhinopithecus bieti]|uniref:suppressor of cytokine signaling 5 isoform X2 n=1 Tax=Rhinopithecus bieti TaxID=61621 RepID=UPI00083C4E93|nr:PREDICTED: suppressor of cytokine signaling 5 isoform X2 [Rhinopithecus bieti]
MKSSEVRVRILGPCLNPATNLCVIEHESAPGTASIKVFQTLPLESRGETQIANNRERQWKAPASHRCYTEMPGKQGAAIRMFGDAAPPVVVPSARTSHSAGP